MTSALADLPSAPPEWRRSGHFLALAAGLHAAVLFLPMREALGKLELPPPAPIMVRLVAAETPAQPMPVQAAPVVAPQPSAQPIRRQGTPNPPRLAMAPEQKSAAAPFTVPETPAATTASAPPAEPTAAASAPVSLTPARFDVAYLQNPRPNYPSLSRRLGEEGKVLLRVVVSPEGQPLTVDLERSSNFSRLDEAARQTVARWRFVPARRGDQAIEAAVIVPLVFRLES
jgi:periplasmic protein TonB